MEIASSLRTEIVILGPNDALFMFHLCILFNRGVSVTCNKNVKQFIIFCFHLVWSDLLSCFYFLSQRLERKRRKEKENSKKQSTLSFDIEDDEEEPDDEEPGNYFIFQNLIKQCSVIL